MITTYFKEEPMTPERLAEIRARVNKGVRLNPQWYRSDVLDLLDEVDAYKKAKAENDERYMLEAAAEREKREAAERERDKATTSEKKDPMTTLQDLSNWLHNKGMWMISSQRYNRWRIEFGTNTDLRVMAIGYGKTWLDALADAVSDLERVRQSPQGGFVTDEIRKERGAVDCDAEKALSKEVDALRRMEDRVRLLPDGYRDPYAPELVALDELRRGR